MHFNNHRFSERKFSTITSLVPPHGSNKLIPLLIPKQIKITRILLFPEIEVTNPPQLKTD